MLKYQIYQSQLKDSPSFGKFYARIISDGTIDVKGLAEHMAKHNTPFSPGTITGIITDAISCIKELVTRAAAQALRMARTTTSRSIAP